LRHLKLLALALAAIALIAAGGCGGDDDDSGSEEALSKEEYASQVRDTLEPLGNELQQIGDAVRSSDNQQELADSVQSAEDELQQSIDQLESLQPPSEAEGANDALINALSGFQGALKELSDAAESEEATQVIETAAKLPAAAQQLQSRLNDVRQQLEDAGIDVGSS
jgi:flagellar hook-associated protein FlgK